MASRVLLLNNGYEAVDIISAERAITLVWLGKAQVVVESDIQWRSVSVTINVPSVVRLVNYVRHLTGKRDVVKLTRKNIMLRDKYTCQYCGVKGHPSELNLDHVIPKSQGGKSEWTNLTTTCIRCNSKKDCRTPKQAGLTLLRKPKKPDFFVFTLYRHHKDVPECWRDYVYWNVELDEK